MISANIVMDGFMYMWLEGDVARPGERPERATLFTAQDESGLSVTLAIRRADLAEFQRQVAELKPPSLVDVVPGGTLPHPGAKNGHRL